MTMIRQANPQDIPAIGKIYDEIHTREEAGEVTTGWIRGVYPTEKTASDSVARGDMFVAEDGSGRIVAAGIINQIQVDVYAKGNWRYEAIPSEVMVLHTLVVSKETPEKGLGSGFVAFFEGHAREQGCKYLRLDTNARNKAARAFYRKLGYSEVGIVPTVFNGIPGVDLVLIEKKLIEQ